MTGLGKSAAPATLAGMIRALSFDAAGTLIEPAEPVAETYARHFRSHGWEVAPAAVRAAFGPAFSTTPDPDHAAFPDGDRAERAWWRAVVFATLRGCGIDPAAAEGRAEACFRDLFACYASARAWRVFPEVGEVLAEARDEGLRVVVVSNFDRRLHRILGEAGLDFDAIVTSADACARKPAPAIFQHALDRLEMAADQVMHAGDSRSADIKGARALGIDGYLVRRPESDLRGFLREARRRLGN